MKLLSRQQWKDWDAFTVENEPITFNDLVERAASACTQWIVDHNLLRKEFHIFCGPGNNGADGFAIARQLANIRSKVVVYLIGDETENDSSELQHDLSKLKSNQVTVERISNEKIFPLLTAESVIIDSIFGTGLNRPVEGLIQEVIEFINRQQCFTLAIDLPSGLQIDQSSLNNAVIAADVTLSFQSQKLCFLLAENQQFTGKVVILDIQLHPAFISGVETEFETIDEQFIHNIYKPRSAFSHKGNHGHALLIAGSKGKTGAALIAAKACLRTGPGLLTCCFPKKILPELLMILPEAMTIPQKLSAVDLSRYSAVGIGPGFSQSAKAEKILDHILSHINQPMVIDADGLNLLSKDPARLASLPPQTILTPHPKEFDRLFGASYNVYERIEKALNATKEFGIIVVLKDHHTMVAAGGKGYFNMNGNAGLAKGGSGDALTGIITALLAQQYEPMHAAVLGVYLHGMAADLALAFQSQESMLASDVIESIGHAFKTLNKKTTPVV